MSMWNQQKTTIWEGHISSNRCKLPITCNILNVLVLWRANLCTHTWKYKAIFFCLAPLMWLFHLTSAEARQCRSTAPSENRWVLNYSRELVWIFRYSALLIMVSPFPCKYHKNSLLPDQEKKANSGGLGPWSPTSDLELESLGCVQRRMQSRTLLEHLSVVRDIQGS